MIRQAFRFLWREPAFTIPATVSLALGICANAAVFAIVNALWLRPLPITEPERVVVIYIPIGAQTAEKEVLDTVRWGLARRLEDARSFAGIVYESTQWNAFAEIRPTVELTNRPGSLRVAAVGHRYFDLLGVPVTGRGFSPEHDESATEPAAVLSDQLWTALGADPRLIGATLETTRGPLRILGVAPRGFSGIRMGTKVDLWLTLGAVPRFARYTKETTTESRIADFIPLTVYARLRPGVSIAEAEAEVRPLVNRRAVLRTLRDVAFPIRAESALRRQESLVRILIVAAAAVLVVGCANLAALLSSRCERRREEFAIRLALGSSRASIGREMLVEILMISIASLGFGLVVAYVIIAGLGTMALPTGIAIADLEPSLDWRVYSLALAMAALSALLAVSRPLLQMRRADVTALLASGTGSTAAPGLSLYRVVAAAHTALTVALVIVAVHLSGIDHVLPIAFLTGGPEYPQALGLTLLAGRTFAESDRQATAILPAIIDENLGRRLWGQITPLGRTMTLLRRKLEVVGVVRDVHASARLDRGAFLVFCVVNQPATIGSAFVAVVRARGTGSSAIPQVNAAVRSVFPDPAFFRVTTANDLIVQAIGGERLGATIFATYGVSAGTLAISGLFGLAILTVARSRRALGIRMALGAGRFQLAMVVGKVALLPVVWGVLAGTFLTWAFARVLQTTVPEYGGVGAMTYLLGTAVYLVAASLAVAPTLLGLRQLRPNEVLRAL